MPGSLQRMVRPQSRHTLKIHFSMMNIGGITISQQAANIGSKMHPTGIIINFCHQAIGGSFTNP